MDSDIGRQILLAVLIVVFVLASAFFSMTETAYSSMNKYRMQIDAENGSREAKGAYWLIKRFDTSLVTILIANNAVNVVLSYASTFLFTAWLPTDMNPTLVSLISSIAITIIVYIFGETLPKQLGKKLPNKIAKHSSFLLIFFFIILFPLTIIFYGFSKLMTMIFKGKTEVELTEDDFNDVLEDNEDHGALEEGETDLIQNTFDFADTAVRDVFTPRKKMTMINIKGMSNDDLVRKLMGINYSRIPVFYDNPNKIVGVLVVKNYLDLYLRNPKVNVMGMLTKPYIVSPSVTMDEMIEGFRKNHTQIALVYKDGVLLGMCTTEDVLEELVGPISEKTTKEVRR